MSNTKVGKRARTRSFQTEVSTILDGTRGRIPERPGLLKTPARVENSLRWLTRGYEMTVADAVGDAVFEENHQSMILVRDIELYSLCEHHLLPVPSAGLTWPTSRIAASSASPRYRASSKCLPGGCRCRSG